MVLVPTKYPSTETLSLWQEKSPGTETRLSLWCLSQEKFPGTEIRLSLQYLSQEKFPGTETQLSLMIFFQKKRQLAGGEFAVDVGNQLFTSFTKLHIFPLVLL